MLNPAALVVLAFAAFRLTRLATEDTITVGWRALLYRFAWDDAKPVTNPETGVLEPGPRAPGRTWVYELLTCAWCLGVWVSAVCYCAWRWGGPGARGVLVVAAIAGAQGFLGSRP